MRIPLVKADLRGPLTRSARAYAKMRGLTLSGAQQELIKALGFRDLHDAQRQAQERLSLDDLRPWTVLKVATELGGPQDTLLLGSLRLKKQIAWNLYLLGKAGSIQSTASPLPLPRELGLLEAQRLILGAHLGNLHVFQRSAVEPKFICDEGLYKRRKPTLVFYDEFSTVSGRVNVHPRTQEAIDAGVPSASYVIEGADRVFTWTALKKLLGGVPAGVTVSRETWARLLEESTRPLASVWSELPHGRTWQVGSLREAGKHLGFVLYAPVAQGIVPKVFSSVPEALAATLDVRGLGLPSDVAPAASPPSAPLTFHPVRGLGQRGKVVKLPLLHWGGELRGPEFVLSGVRLLSALPLAWAAFPWAVLGLPEPSVAVTPVEAARHLQGYREKLLNKKEQAQLAYPTAQALVKRALQQTSVTALRARVDDLLEGEPWIPEDVDPAFEPLGDELASGLMWLTERRFWLSGDRTWNAASLALALSFPEPGVDRAWAATAALLVDEGWSPEQAARAVRLPPTRELHLALPTLTGPDVPLQSTAKTDDDRWQFGGKFARNAHGIVVDAVQNAPVKPPLALPPVRGSGD